MSNLTVKLKLSWGLIVIYDEVKTSARQNLVGCVKISLSKSIVNVWPTIGVEFVLTDIFLTKLRGNLTLTHSDLARKSRSTSTTMTAMSS